MMSMPCRNRVDLFYMEFLRTVSYGHQLQEKGLEYLTDRLSATLNKNHVFMWVAVEARKVTLLWREH